MRFPLAALYLVIAGFMFLAFFGVGSLLLSEMEEALEANDDGLDNQFNFQTDLIISGFGLISAILFLLSFLVFVIESLSDEPEYYYRRR